MTKIDTSYLSLIEEEADTISLLANTSAYLNQMLDNINWVGFYRLINDQLILGPFQGKVACTVIQVGKGVCGHVAQTNLPIIVPDVHEFAGHIACDAASQSEMVIPIFIKGKLYGVLDIDAPIKNRFTDKDLETCQSIIHSLEDKLATLSSASR